MSDVTDSILLSVKKMNSVAPEYTAFDDDFVLWINSALSDLNQLGIGPAEGFAIEDENDLWEDFMEEGPILNRVKTFVGLHVRLRFDPPATSFTITMMEKQIEEHAFRLIVAMEDKQAEEAGL
jgi:hypothetical protein